MTAVTRQLNPRVVLVDDVGELVALVEAQGGGHVRLILQSHTSLEHGVLIHCQNPRSDIRLCTFMELERKLGIALPTEPPPEKDVLVVFRYEDRYILGPYRR